MSPDPPALDIPGLQNPRVIGRGGFGTVFSADEPEFGRSVAVKVLHDRLDGDSVRNAFVRECQAMGDAVRAPAHRHRPPRRHHRWRRALHRHGPDAGRVAGRPHDAGRPAAVGRGPGDRRNGGGCAGDRAPGRHPAQPHHRPGGRDHPPDTITTATVLDGYFLALNVSRYDEAFAVFSPDSDTFARGLDAFAQAQSSTIIEFQRITGVSDRGSGAVEVDVTFESTQVAELGYQAQTGTDWALATR